LLCPIDSPPLFRNRKASKVVGAAKYFSSIHPLSKAMRVPCLISRPLERTVSDVAIRLRVATQDSQLLRIFGRALARQTEASRVSLTLLQEAVHKMQPMNDRL
jgi:hypothetical protein